MAEGWGAGKAAEAVDEKYGRRCFLLPETSRRVQPITGRHMHRKADNSGSTQATASDTLSEMRHHLCAVVVLLEE